MTFLSEPHTWPDALQNILTACHAVWLTRPKARLKTFRVMGKSPMLVTSKERGLELVLYMTGPKLMPLAGVTAYLEKAARKFTCKHVACPSQLQMDGSC